jgi:hypothetical protein
MREKWQKQMPLMSHIADHAQAKELEMISRIIDANSTICTHILQDLNRGKVETQRAGAKGMSAEQVLRCTIVKTLFDLSYEELAFILWIRKACVGFVASEWPKKALKSRP